MTLQIINSRIDYRSFFSPLFAHTTLIETSPLWDVCWLCSSSNIWLLKSDKCGRTASSSLTNPHLCYKFCHRSKLATVPSGPWISFPEMSLGTWCSWKNLKVLDSEQEIRFIQNETNLRRDICQVMDSSLIHRGSESKMRTCRLHQSSSGILTV